MDERLSIPRRGLTARQIVEEAQVQLDAGDERLSSHSAPLNRAWELAGSDGVTTRDQRLPRIEKMIAREVMDEIKTISSILRRVDGNEAKDLAVPADELVYRNQLVVDASQIWRAHAYPVRVHDDRLFAVRPPIALGDEAQVWPVETKQFVHLACRIVARDGDNIEELERSRERWRTIAVICAFVLALTLYWLLISK